LNKLPFEVYTITAISTQASYSSTACFQLPSAAVGGIIGFSLVFAGGAGVVWYAPAKEFPFVGGIVPVIISWFLSPLLAALITLVLFVIIRTLVLRRAASTKIAFWVLPILILLTFFINLFFILVGPARSGRRGSGCLGMETLCPCSRAAAFTTMFSDMAGATNWCFGQM